MNDDESITCQLFPDYFQVCKNKIKIKTNRKAIDILRADYFFVKIDINASRKNKQHSYIVLHYIDNRFSSFVFQETERKKR